MQRIKEQNVTLVVYEPGIKDMKQLEKMLSSYDSEKLRLEQDLAAFKEKCHIIAANRWNDELQDVREKVYTRDIFERD